MTSRICRITKTFFQRIASGKAGFDGSKCLKEGDPFACLHCGKDCIHHDTCEELASKLEGERFCLGKFEEMVTPENGGDILFVCLLCRRPAAEHVTDEVTRLIISVGGNKAPQNSSNAPDGEQQEAANDLDVHPTKPRQQTVYNLVNQVVHTPASLILKSKRDEHRLKQAAMVGLPPPATGGSAPAAAAAAAAPAAVSTIGLPKPAPKANPKPATSSRKPSTTSTTTLDLVFLKKPLNRYVPERRGILVPRERGEDDNAFHAMRRCNQVAEGVIFRQGG